jgi:hypothetical protein
MEALTFVVKDRTKIGMSPSSACFLDARPGPQGQPQRVESSEVSGFNGQVTGDRGRVDDSAWGSLSGLPFVSFRNEKLRSRGD